MKKLIMIFLGTMFLIIGIGLGTYFVYVWSNMGNFSEFNWYDARTLISSLVGIVLGPTLLFKAFKKGKKG